MGRFNLATSTEECRGRAAKEPRTMLYEAAPTAEAGNSYFFEHPIQWIEIQTLQQIPSAFAAIEKAKSEGFWIAGYLGYECGYHWEPAGAPNFQPSSDLPLGAFGVYRPPTVPVHSGVQQSACGLTDVTLSLSREEFEKQFRHIQQWIADGDTYQVDLTCRVEAVYSHPADVLFSHMMLRQPVAFGAMLNIGGKVILSASPELFFQLERRKLRVRPMKGTSRRGTDETEDAVLANGLANDEKNRSENVMIVDLLRSDIGRIAKFGSVRVEDLFTVERHPSLLQMTSTIVGELREDISLYELFRAIFPSGSIVGAPKVRTMQIIRQLEGRDRGVYTGAIGYIKPDGDAVFSVAIRTAVLSESRVSIGVGAGITAGSNSNSEFEECLLKAKFLEERSFELLESIRWESGSCQLLSLHMKRIERSARRFGFVFDQQSIRLAISGHASQLASDGAWKLRLAMNSAGICTITSSRIQTDTPSIPKVRLWPVPIHSSDVWLQHKTTRRILYDRALALAEKAGCVDAVFQNERGMVTEGAIHSILVRSGHIWRTPPLEAGILPGVFRQHLLRIRPEIREEDINVGELSEADEIYLMNAVRGLRRVELQKEMLIYEAPN